jgi:hypothetical protein
MSFLKRKIWNQLNLHLQLLVTMYAQFFFILNLFPYATTFDNWANVMTTNGQGQYEYFFVFNFHDYSKFWVSPFYFDKWVLFCNPFNHFFAI